MLPEHIELEVVTPGRHMLHAVVDSVELRGKDGYLGILPGHAPLLTELGYGELTFRRGSETGLLTIMGGVAEVLPARVIVLAEVSEKAPDIDVKRAEDARARAQARLNKPEAEMDWARASLAYEKALVRLHVAARKAGFTGKT
jgi:F-type H+-transporting ATPase subunit epsilon